MITLKQANFEDAPLFAAMEAAEGTKEFVLACDAGEHRRTMAHPGLVYLRILDDDALAGFFILAVEAGHSVELRRIVVSRKGRGVGQQAMLELERYCRERFGCIRIWLDVFDHNRRGRHVYEKLGYVRFGEARHAGKLLLLYEKRLTPAEGRAHAALGRRE